MLSLPLEMLETVLMRTFLMLYITDCEGDVDHPRCKPGKSVSSEHRAFTLLTSVCSDWHLALTGWPQSPTRYWVRHQLRKLIERECTRIYAHTICTGWAKNVLFLRSENFATSNDRKASKVSEFCLELNALFACHCS